MTSSVLVLGAGMVGTCTAIHLAQRGHQVVLADRRAPGEETSYGNAGLIQQEAVEPYAFPREAAKLLRAAFKRGLDVNYHAAALPGLAGPLARYWQASGPAHYPAIAQAYARLIAQAIPEHAPLIAAAGAEDLVQRTGYRWVFRETATMDEALARAERLHSAYGVRHVAMDAGALAAAEPALKARLAGAIHWPDPWAVRDPGALVARYAAHFTQLGGRIVKADAGTLRENGAGWSLQSADGPLEAEHAVIALGPWADTLLRPLGYRLPLFVKRGYHRHYTGGPVPTMPWLDADRGLVVAPMQRGVRLTTGAEFAARDAAATPWQLAGAEAAARELLDLPQPVEATPWRGARPCTADMLPVVGAAPRHRGLWFNFGHAHQGFTLGPACGRLLAELIDGQPPMVDPAPYAPARF
ncbi:FAD-binding oxidoreductase [Pseudorhodoferax sp. Leaf267]|uniref:NAD(P)/FAD-dependent oxidoreductase n=1 Tax=Pseudorhodoferax sp. Leaf267 TaxID=1736316 RepID=UPI0006F826D7|nr:FAD-dependent oxidoreductase [Pseudorhodoferax sp. Leaf267]KQP14093.1 amino acid dehydrogenase [Pseudorhodoferax sp. Leaf267]